MLAPGGKGKTPGQGDPGSKGPQKLRGPYAMGNNRHPQDQRNDDGGDHALGAARGGKLGQTGAISRNAEINISIRMVPGMLIEPLTAKP